MTRASRPAFLLVAGLAAAMVFVALYARLWPYTIDDAYISLRYAQNLAMGHGLVYNLGEKVDGYTNFLWTVGLAIPHLIHVDPVLAIKIVNLLLVLGTALALYSLGRASLFAPGTAAGVAPTPRGASRGATGKRGSGAVRAAPEAADGSSSVLAVLPALLLLVSPLTAVSAAEGLETTLFTFLLVLSTAWFFEERAPGRFPRSALALAALGLTRPDGASFGVYLFACATLQRRPGAYLARFAAIVFGIGLAYFALRWLYYGHPLPNTLYAKGGGTLQSVRTGWEEVGRFAAASGAWGWLLIFPVLVAGRARGTAWVIAGVVLLRIAFDVWAGGPWLGRFRFLVPAVPFIHLLVVAGCASLVRTPLVRAAAIAAGAALLLIPGWLAQPGVEARALRYAEGLARAQIPLGLEVRTRTGSAAVMAMDDAGAGPYLAERTNIDMLGLNDAHIAHLKGRYSIKSDPAYVLGRAPDLIVLAARVPTPTGPNDFRLHGHGRLFLEPGFQARYRPVRRYEFNPSYYLVVYRRLDSTQVPANF